jgi:hypothetical protein
MALRCWYPKRVYVQQELPPRASETLMNCRMPKRTLCRCVAIPAVFLSVFCGLSADAGTIVEGNVAINITGSTEDAKMQMSDQVNIPIASDGSFSMTKVATSNAMWAGELGAFGNIDPVANHAYSVTNNLAVPVIFTVSVTLPIAPIGPGTFHGGSTGGSTSDFSNDGLGGLSTLAGLPYYAGQIDGSTVRPEQAYSSSC